jgi:hypothetical protein
MPSILHLMDEPSSTVASAAESEIVASLLAESAVTTSMPPLSMALISEERPAPDDAES